MNLGIIVKNLRALNTSIFCLFIVAAADVYAQLAVSDSAAWTPPHDYPGRLFARNSLRLQTEFPTRETAGSTSESTEIDSISGQRLLVLMTDVELWHASWLSLSFVEAENIKPAYIISPTVTVKFQAFTLSLRINKTLKGLLYESIEAYENLVQTEYVSVSGQFKYGRAFPILIITARAGSFKVTGGWSFMEDTLDYEWEYERFNIKTNSIFLDFEIGTILREISSLKHFFGIRYMRYNTPIIYTLSTVTDPRNPDNMLDEVELVDARIRHFFVVYDLLAQFKSHEFYNRKEQAPTFELAGHAFIMPVGIGYANIEKAGRKMTSSFGGIEFDLAARANLRLGRSSSMSLSLGVRWFSWEVMAENENSELSAISYEIYFGPYFALELLL